jgi:hypothetical protein
VRGQPQHRGLSARELKTFKVTGQAELVLDTFDGAIELHSWDKNEIEVEVEKARDGAGAARRDQGRRAAAGRQDHLKVTGPAAPTIAASRSACTSRRPRASASRCRARQHQRDERRRIDPRRGDRRHIVLHTTDGSVTGTRLGGDIQIRSGDGSIRIDNTTGKLDLETDDGSIGVEAKPSVLRAQDRRRIDSRHVEPTR